MSFESDIKFIVIVKSCFLFSLWWALPLCTDMLFFLYVKCDILRQQERQKYENSHYSCYVLMIRVLQILTKVLYDVSSKKKNYLVIQSSRSIGVVLNNIETKTGRNKMINRYITKKYE